MKKHGALRAAFTLACLLLVAACADRGEYVPVDKQKLKGSGTVYFVPLGDFPPDVVESLIPHYRDKYGLDIKTAPAVPLAAEAINPRRRQLIAEAAVDLMKQAHPELANDPKAILIGLTNVDMYIARYDWQFTFSWRGEGKYAVVSNARMSLGSTVLPAEKVESRLRKMVTKNIGILYYRLPQSDDPRSVLYKNVGGISELDYMGEEF